MCELDPPTPDFSSLVRVKQLYPGQPAQRSGRIQEGDVLLAIDGQSLKELPYSVCAAFNSLICLYSLCFHLLGVIDQFDTLSISILINCKLLKGKLSFSLFHVGHISVYFQIIFWFIFSSEKHVSPDFGGDVELLISPDKLKEEGFLYVRKNILIFLSHTNYLKTLLDQLSQSWKRGFCFLRP